MRKDTLTERFQALGRPTKVSITIPVGTLLRVDAIAKERGLSRREAILEALRDYSVRREQSLNRRRRLELTKAMREAADQKPIAELLDRFRAQMEAAGESKTPLTSAEPPDINTEAMANGGKSTKSLRERREALGLSREALARIAGISAPTIAQFENGIRPKESKALPLLEETLTKQERVAA